MSELKDYRVVISYVVHDEGWVEATSEDEARDLILSGREHPDWKELFVTNWQLEEVTLDAN